MRVLLAVAVGLAVAWSLGILLNAQGSVTVSGQVLGPDGSPSSLTYLQLCSVPDSGCQRVQTDLDGRFEFEASLGSYRLAVFNPLGGPELFYLEGGEGNLSWDSSELTTIEVESTSVSGISVTLPAPTEVAGDIRRSDGSPQPNALIVLCRTVGQPCRPDTTDDQGRFSFLVPRDEYRMLIQVPGDYPQFVFDPDTPGGFPENHRSPGPLIVGATPQTGIEIVLPPLFDEHPPTISGRVMYPSGMPVDLAVITACLIATRVCDSFPTTADGDFRFIPDIGEGEYDIRIDARGVSGYYSRRSPGSFSESESDKTVLTTESGPVSGLEISIPLPLQVAGRIVDSAGRPSVGTTAHVCREVPVESCVETETDAHGRFSIDVSSGDYYVAFTIASNERWYYHAGSDGRLISTGRRPERTFVGVPSAEAAHMEVRIPQRDFVEFLVSDTNRGVDDDSRVDISACRVVGTAAAFLPPCLRATEDVHLDSGVRRVRLPLPDEPYHFMFSFIGYALSGTVEWYYDRESPSGLTNDFTRATRFAADSPPPSTLSVRLPDLPRTISVTLHLQPGVNLVGWPGGTISLADLARQIPALKGVVSIPRDSGVGSRAYTVRDPDGPELVSSSLWWFYVALDEPTAVSINTPPKRVGYSHYGHPVEEGRSFLAWTGPQNVTLEQATAGLGSLRSAPRLVRWTGTGVEYADSGLVQQGDIIQIDSPRRFFAQLPIPRQPYFVLLGSADDHWELLPQRFTDVQSFFWKEYGVQRNDVTVYYRTVTDVPTTLEGRCGSAWVHITLVCGEPHAIAKYYFRFLQWNMSHILNRPGWLIEGAMEYAAARYTQHAQGRSGDPLSLHRLAARNGGEEHRTLRQLPSDIRTWRDDPAATRLAALAVDWLVRHSGDPDSLFNVFRIVSDYFLTDQRNDHDWERAFEEAFGIEIDDFYERFAEYRANGFRLHGG